MATLDFPDTPVVGDLYGSAGTLWRWDGTRWASTVAASGAKGRVAYAQVNADQAGITALADLTGLSATWVADPARSYRTTVSCEMYSTVANDTSAAWIVTGAGVGLKRAAACHGVGGQPETHVVQVVESGLSGSTTRKAQAMRVNGTGSMTSAANGTNPAFILVEDVTLEAGSAGSGAVGNFVGARVRRAATQLITTGGGATNVTFDTEDADTHGFYAPAAPTIMTIPAGQAGMYLVGGEISAAANTGTDCYSDLKVDGVVVQRLPARLNTSPPFPAFAYPLNVGQTLAMAIFHSAGVSVNFTARMNLIRLSGL